MPDRSPYLGSGDMPLALGRFFQAPPRKRLPIPGGGYTVIRKLYLIGLRPNGRGVVVLGGPYRMDWEVTSAIRALVLRERLSRPVAAQGVGLEIPTTRAAIDAFEQHLRELEGRVRQEPKAFWDVERALVFEATNFAFLLRSVRSLLRVVADQQQLLDGLRRHAAASEKPRQAHRCAIRPAGATRSRGGLDER